jgi:AhpD family alkylhydroperoxidase
MQPRMNHPAMIVPGAYQSLQDLTAAIQGSGLDQTTIDLVLLRASQINGCSFCAEMHGRDLRKAGQSDERLFTVAAWREAPYFTDAERVALEVTEALTRIADMGEPFSDELFERATRHYSEQTLAGLFLAIAMINVWNRLNVAVRQPAGSFHA